MQNTEFASNNDDESKNRNDYMKPCLPAALGSLKVAEEVNPLDLHLLLAPPPPPPKANAKLPPPLRGDVNVTSTGAAAASIGSSLPMWPSYPPPPLHGGHKRR